MSAYVSVSVYVSVCVLCVCLCLYVGREAVYNIETHRHIHRDKMAGTATPHADRQTHTSSQAHTDIPHRHTHVDSSTTQAVAHAPEDRMRHTQTQTHTGKVARMGE